MTISQKKFGPKEKINKIKNRRRKNIWTAPKKVFLEPLPKKIFNSQKKQTRTKQTKNGIGASIHIG